MKKSAKGGGVFLFVVDAVAPNHSFTSTPAEATKCSQCIEGGRLVIKVCIGGYNEVESFVPVRLLIDSNLI